MIASDEELRNLIANGSVRIRPNVRSVDIRPCGIRLHLGGELLIPQITSRTVSIRDPDIEWKSFEIDRVPYILEPHSFALGTTREAIEIDAGWVGHLDNRSTCARLGLMVHGGSTTFDSAHFGCRSAVLELANVGPLRLELREGDPIVELQLERLVGRIQQEPSGQYAGQLGVLPPRAPSHDTDNEVT